MLEKFHNQIGRRAQRFPRKSPTYSAIAGLGWINICTYIKAKKVLFVRSICIMNDQEICKDVFISRANTFNDNIASGSDNCNFSPVFSILNACIDLGLYNEAMGLILGDRWYDKNTWKNMVWVNVWRYDRKSWKTEVMLNPRAML